jgi:hypothetical protein
MQTICTGLMGQHTGNWMILHGVKLRPLKQNCKGMEGQWQANYSANSDVMLNAPSPAGALPQNASTNFQKQSGSLNTSIHLIPKLFKSSPYPHPN